MIGLFLKIVNMSITASWLVAAVLVLRLALRKAPKWARVLLWGIVAVRLICPFSVESALSLIPSMETLPDRILIGPSFQVQSGVAPVDRRVNEYLRSRYFEGVTVPAENGRNVMAVLTVIWIVGAVLLLFYMAVSYLRLRRQVSTAVRFKGSIFQSGDIPSPFVLGILKPRIYLPFGLDGQSMEHVVAHEQAHIRRRDHWWKPLGFLLLTVYWFNPLMWLAYVLLCRDIELACDEKVIRELGTDQRADYSQALLACSVSPGRITACPLAFGEVGVRERVKSVLRYKKPGFWLVAAAAAACGIAAVCFLTDPAKEELYAPEPFGHSYLVEKILYDAPQYSFTDTAESAPGYTFSSDYAMLVKGDLSADAGGDKQGYAAYGFRKIDLERGNFDDCFLDVDGVSGWEGGEDSAASLRRENSSAWCLEEEGENNVFYYLMLQKDGGTYLACGCQNPDRETFSPSHIRWLFRLKRTDRLDCHVVSSDVYGGYYSTYLSPRFYQDPTEVLDWEQEDIAEGVVMDSGSGSLVFGVDWDTDTLVVHERYYKKDGEVTVTAEDESYRLFPDSEGVFVLDVARRGGEQEEALYFVEGNGGEYVVRILYEAADTSYEGSLSVRLYPAGWQLLRQISP